MPTVTQTMTVPVGTVLSYTYTPPDYSILWFMPADQFSTPPSLINYGEMHYNAGNAIATAFIQFTTASSWDGAIIENHGLIDVVADNSSQAFALRATSWSPDLVNSGTIRISAATGQAIGFESWASGLNITNTATGVIEGYGETVLTLYLGNGANLVNDGQILARGTEWGAAVVYFSGHGSLLNNGLIEASDTDPSTFESIAFDYFGFDMGDIINNGTLRGEFAIKEENVESNPPIFSKVYVENNGLLDGYVYLGDGDDVLKNNADIIGDVDLGRHNDTYDGRLGTIDGVVFGWEGDDVFWGGAGNEYFLGEAGNDTLSGGVGADTLDGGAGADIAAYDESPRAVSLDLASSTYSGGDANGDVLIAIEGLRGSAFNDTLAGNSDANNLSGLAGNDTLIGRDGDDYLNGGAGVDSFDGGAGVDRVSFFAPNATQGASADLTAQTIANDGFGNAETMTGIESLGAATAFADFFNGNDSNNEFLVGVGDEAHGLGGDDLFWVAGAPLRLTGGGGVDRIDFSGEEGKIVPDSNGDGLAELVYATHGVNVDIATGTIIDDGFGASTGPGAFLEFEILGATKFADTIMGDANANEIYGREGNDSLSGADGNDTLVGDAGTDTLWGGAGADSLIGGAGLDTAAYDTSASAVTVDLQTGIHAGGDAAGDLLSGIEDISGSAFDDILSGDAQTNRLFGLGGNDRLIGRDGADALFGDAGDDFLQGGRDADYLDGGAGIDIASYETSSVGVTVNLTVGWAVSAGDAAGDNWVSIENVAGSNANDTLIGNTAANTLYGNGGIDFIQGAGGADTVFGGDGDDWLDGGVGGDTIDGGAGLADVAAYGASGAAVALDLQAGTYTGGDAAGDVLSGIEGLSGSSFADQLFGNGSSNRLFGQGGADFIQGRAGSDIIDGGDGDDWLDGGAGADQIFGGNGANDIVAYGASSAAVNADLAAFVFSGGDAAGDTYSGVEGVSGSGFADQLFGDANANRLFGQGGNDFIQGRAGADLIDGGDGDDWLDGGTGADQIFGGNGANDVVAYGASTSAINADLAAFTFTGGDAAGDTYSGVEGVSGSAFNDNIFGDASANRLFGQGGNDFIQGRAGADLIEGGDGDDWLDGGLGGDTITGGNGANDVAAYGGSTAAVSLDLQANVFSGGDAAGDTLSGIEGLSGSALNDTLSGNASANRLFGQGGNDTLAGRGGNDLLTGGANDDTFVFADNGGVDQITDFDDAGNDIIQLSIAGVTTFAQVSAVMTQVGADVLIDFATTDILLTGTTLATVQTDDFAFV